MPAKKILLIANTAWNIWNYRQALIRALIDAGYELVLAAPHDRFQTALIQQYKIRFVPLNWLSRRSFSPLQNLRSLLEFYQLFRSEQPDMALLFTIKPNILGNIAARFAGASTISVVEGLGYSGTLAARWRWLIVPVFRFAIRHASNVVFLNQEDCTEFQELGIVTKPQAIIIKGPGVDIEHFCPDKRSPDKQLVFLFCARLLSEKGIYEFIEAARQMQRQDVLFQVLGSPDPGNPASLKEEEVKGWAQEGIVQVLGQTDDVRPYLAAADVLVLPSYYREGMPRSILEGMAMEMIIVTSDTAGCRDTVEEGRNGFLLPVKRADLLVQVFKHILSLTPAQRHAMGKSSRHIVATTFSDAQVIPQYLALIEDSLNQA